jgi:hypothetical protein
VLKDTSWRHLRRVAQPTLVWSLCVLASGCSSESTPEPVTEQAQEAALFSPADLDRLWQIQMVDDAVRAPFESSGGWIQLVMRRDLQRALAGMGATPGIASARVHSEAADMYRQAALLAANALVETYEKTAKDTDPAEIAHLLAVSHVIKGDREKAKAIGSAFSADLTKSWHTPWKAWLGSDSAWPPDLSALPLELPEVTVGQWPDAPGVPTYQLPERDEEARLLDVSDPAILVALSLWHQKAVVMAAPEDTELLALYGVRHRLPIEKQVAVDRELPLELLFGSDYLGAWDASFMAAVLTSDVSAAIEKYTDRSPLAMMAAKAQRDGKLDAELAIDLVAELRQAIVDGMSQKSEGSVQGFHREFAEIGAVGALRNLALVAERQGDRETSGRLRINALERSGKSTACPVAFLSLSAWDANNRYPTRATELLHNLIRRYPSLETARFGLEVLALRVSRERGRQAPGM